MCCNGPFSALDRNFAAFMEKLSGGKAPEVFAAAALASCRREMGHVCLDLPTFAGEEITAGESIILCPPLEDWIAALRQSDVVGLPGDYRPLILNGTRLYLYRYWDYENRVAERLRADAAWTEPDLDRSVLESGLARFFPVTSADPDLQRVAACVSVLKRFSVISGGPGTGKTTTVARILALLLEQAAAKKSRAPRIALCAPTGKAAARLREAISRDKDRLNCTEEIKKGIPDQASTIHRLLGRLSGEPSDFDASFGASELLPFDMLVIDEASMIDLPLLARLLKALPSGARFILLGDKDQLASVEAGSVLADICGTASGGRSPALCRLVLTFTGVELSANPDASPLDDCVVQLQKRFRFGKDSGMEAVSRLINRGDAEGATTLLRSHRHSDIHWCALPAAEVLSERLRDKVIQEFAPYLAGTDPDAALLEFNRFRVLCALREGPYGIEAVNTAIEKLLSEAGLIPRKELKGGYYQGRPVLITRNDYSLKLFNGDVGIILPDPESGRLWTFFQNADGGIRKIPPLRLPEHETAFAMTVHKSQGSEFDRTILILPDRPSPVLTRELLYTAVTRARLHTEVWGTDDVFRFGVGRKTERASGLRHALIV